MTRWLGLKPRSKQEPPAGGATVPTVLRAQGFRFYFWSHEPNEPPHVHVDRSGVSAKVWLSAREQRGLPGARVARRPAAGARTPVRAAGGVA
ncbi:MAG: DUF4160 domain-containing protein [Acidisphaera sp.]|nr:DUF4160 domain-containing protein [Acidisphaera sp.]